MIEINLSLPSLNIGRIQRSIQKQKNGYRKGREALIFVLSAKTNLGTIDKICFYWKSSKYFQQKNDLIVTKQHWLLLLEYC